MSNVFDALVDEVDNIHQKTFAIDVTIDGEDCRGIFDEKTDEFEGVGTGYRTFEIPESDLPVAIENGRSQLYLIATDRTFTIHLTERIGTQVMMELR